MGNLPDIPGGTFPGRHSPRDRSAYEAATGAFEASSIPLLDKLECFPRFTTKRSLARFLARERLFERILNVHGIIVECGVFHGAGLFTWAQLSSIHEPSNHTRRIVGFDTFSGFPSVHAADNAGNRTSQPGDLQGSPLGELLLSVQKSDQERYLSHIPNIELVAGDVIETAPRYLDSHPHTLIALLYLDFDLYEPTRAALEHFLPRMPKGAVVAFDELNCESFPGETRAFLEQMGTSRFSLQRFPWDPWISYVQL